MTSELFARKHDLWLRLLFTSFMAHDTAVKSELYDFAMIAFRHMRWIARALREAGVEYNYDRAIMLEKEDSFFMALRRLIADIEATRILYPDTVLFERIETDERYLLIRLQRLHDDHDANHPVTAFDLNRTLPGKALSAEQTDALTLFLFEESYKEYELILVYAYMQNFSDDLQERDIYQDLIDESHFHLKSFGEMMAKMGILALPRPLHERTYRIGDVEGFIRNGIEEEESAKEQCRALALAVGDDELSAFFEFINYQESYHIALMQQLLTP